MDLGLGVYVLKLLLSLLFCWSQKQQENDYLNYYLVLLFHKPHKHLRKGSPSMV